MSYRRKHERTTRSGTWVWVGDCMTRLVDFRNLEWQLPANLSSFLVAYSGAGGPIAVCPKKIPPAGSSILFYNSLGAQMAQATSIPVAASEAVTFLCWDVAHDNLVVVHRSGIVRLYNMRGESAAPSVTTSPPLLCSATGNGVAIIAKADSPSVSPLRLTVIEATDDSGAEYRATSVDLPSALIAQPPTQMLTVPRQLSDTGYTELYVASSAVKSTSNSGSCSVFHCVFQPKPRCYDLKVTMPGGDVVHMALSPGATAIAIMMRDGSLFTANRSFEELAFLFNIDTEVAPAQVMWCGERCFTYIHLSSQFEADMDFSTTLTVCSPRAPDESDFLNDLPPDAFLVQDCDGIRILSGETLQFLQAIPDEGRRLFAVGSRANSALLLMAYDAFMMEDAAAVKTIRELQSDVDALCEAIDDCVTIAGCEFESEQQKRLLRVASFGMSLCGVYDSDNFVNMARRLRVLAALRKPPVGMIMSISQLLAVEGDHLSERLLLINEFQLAFAICDTLSLRSVGIIKTWAHAKLGQRVPAGQAGVDYERELAGVLISKLVSCPEASVADVAFAAFKKQKPRTALLLLEAEPRLSRQIPMLVDIKQPEIALRRAILCGNPDLIFSVVVHFLCSRGSGASSVLMGDAVTCNMLLGYANACDGRREHLTEFFRTFPQYQTYQSLLHYFTEEGRLKAALGHGIFLSRASTIGGGGDLRQQNRANGDWGMMHECAVSAIQSATLAAKREGEAATGSGSGGTPLPPPTSSMYALPFQVNGGMTNSYAVGGSGVPAAVTAGGGITALGSGGVNAAANALAGVGSGVAMAGGMLVAGLTGGGAAPVISNERFLRYQGALLDDQAKLARDTGDTRFLGASVATTITLCAELNKGGQAESLRSKYNVAEKTYCWCLLRAYLKNAQWDRIDKLAAVACKKKGVVSPVSLITALVACERLQQAQTYVPLISSIEERMEYYVKCSDWFGAASDCKRSDEPGLVQQLRDRAKGNQAALEQIDQGWSSQHQPSGGLLFSKLLSK